MTKQYFSIIRYTQGHVFKYIPEKPEIYNYKKTNGTNKPKYFWYYLLVKTVTFPTIGLSIFICCLLFIDESCETNTSANANVNACYTGRTFFLHICTTFSSFSQIRYRSKLFSTFFVNYLIHFKKRFYSSSALTL